MLNTTICTIDNYQQQIINFNADVEVIRLREKYNEPTFFEIISKERSETTYSSFLKWLFKESTLSLLNDANPLLLLFDILVKKGDKTASLDNNLQIAILSRSLFIKKVDAEVEMSVASLALEAKESLEKESIRQNIDYFVKNCKDKIDLFIDCDIDGADRNKIQIIIENKIDSFQGIKNSKGEHIITEYFNNVSQTSRYFMGTKRNDNFAYQIYVYLTPVDNNESINDHFIHITYQDILDGVINPMTASSSLSSRSRFFLEEFRNQLTFPRSEKSAVYKSLAIGEDQSMVFLSIWKKHNSLIRDSIQALNQTTIWKYGDDYYLEYPRDLLAKDIIQKEPSKKSLYYREGKLLRKKKTLEKDADNLRVDKPQLVKCSNDPDTLLLLSSFLGHNVKLLTALLSGLNNKMNVISILLSELSRRDTTKFTLKYNGRIISEHQGKRATILKAFESMIKDKDLPENTLKIGNNKFYYEKQVFEESHNDGNITDDMFFNRYSIVGDYYVYNQWGVGNWKEAEALFDKKDMSLISE